jgi:uncharacterized membrane protein
MLYKTLKVLHLIGIIVFLGSVLGHVATGALGGTVISSPEFLAARENIATLTRILTLPGLALTMASGLALASVARMNPIHVQWLGLHGALAVVVVVLTATVVAPAGRRVLQGALSVGTSAVSLPDIQASLMSEHVFGAVNIALSLAAIGLAVWRPRFSRRLPAARPLRSTHDVAAGGR